MTFAPGFRLGPYEILSQIGAGGMGQVWKAKDARLDRFVAIKILPEHLNSNAEALGRFEREAKAVAALNHPNILSIFDIGTQDSVSYAVMELLEGESLRARLAQGPLAPRKATDLSIQMANGLAAAHEKGVVHRDLKPENLWITKDGRLKILDFGLAKQTYSLPPGGGSQMPTQSMGVGGLAHTGEGMILGTVGYMSPEQVRGEPVDARSDIFSFGVVLFEMLTGHRAFARGTAADTMAAILKEDPPELEDTTRPVPLGLRRVLDHCLEKSPSGRFQGAHDLAFALEATAAPSTTESGSSLLPPAKGTRFQTWLKWAAIYGAIPVLLFAGWLTRGTQAPPTFKRLTYGKGTVDAARFAPSSQEVLFSARWNGAPPEIFTLNPDSTEPRSLGIRGASLMSISPSGELAVKQDPRLWGGNYIGGMARVTPGGGSRVTLSEVVDADWMPGGTQLASMRGAGSFVKDSSSSTTEFPPGHPIAGLRPFDWGLRVSPKGDHMACLDQSGVSHGDGRVIAVDRQGKVTTLAEVKGCTGLAWGPQGDEVWYSDVRNGSTAIWAVTLSGRKRLLMRQAGLLELLDVDPDGRVLAALGLMVSGTMGMTTPDFREKDLSWNDAASALDISPDGRNLILGSELWDTESNHHVLYLRQSDGTAPVRLGEGVNASILPGGTQVLVLPFENATHLTLIPLGPGQTRDIPLQGDQHVSAVEAFPDGKRALVEDHEGKFFIAQLADGSVRPLPITARLVGHLNRFLGDSPISPDGNHLILSNTTSKVLDPPLLIIPLDGSEPVALKGQEPGDIPLRWSADGKSFFVFNRDGLPARIHRIDIATGKRTLVREIMPTNPAGLSGIRTIAMTPDARTFAYNYVRKLSDLYLIEGLK